MLMAALVTLPGMVQAASKEIWPSERRAKNTYFCYGNDWNSMLLAIYPENFGKQRLQLPEQFAEPTVLTLTLPAAVKFVGANLMHVPGVSPDFPSEAVTMDGKAYPRIRMTLPSEGLTARRPGWQWRAAHRYFDLAQPAHFDPAGDYMLGVQLKVEDLHHTGDWYGRPAGLRLYVYGQNDKHVWLAVHGAGSTKGWMTGVLPFPGSEAVRPDFAHSRVLLRCYNMTGTVSFRKPMIVLRPAGLDSGASFTLEDGTQISSAALQLRM